ncbi:three-prime repair exonuclease 1 [Anopheles nili]|uniref:three-prime repair exonuclease 1 n=1 Tax=Anopheles nili TaxID=185578 RepID=UPI00237BAD32|nr:three-prime repair exonuclease 1 [Anopheles nili]
MVEIKSFVFFDLETTGIPEYEFFKTKITELSLVACSREHFLESVIEQPRVLHKLSLCFNPARVISIGASQSTGLYNDLLENESKFDENVGVMVKMFLDRLQKPACLVAHNGDRFDFIILKRHMQKIGIMLPEDLHYLDSLAAFRNIETDLEAATNNDKDGAENEISELEYQAVRSMEQLEQANDILAMRRKINETTPQGQRLEQNYKQTLREFLNGPAVQEQTPIQPSKGEGNSSPPLGQSKARKRLFDTAASDVTQDETKQAGPSERKLKKRYNLSELYKRTIGKELVKAHRAEEDVLALMECARMHSARFVRYADTNCVTYDGVKSIF